MTAPHIDLDRLEAVAKAATPGPWMRLFGERTVYDRMEDGCRGNAIVRADPAFSSKDANNLDFIAAANPAVVLELVARLRDQAKDIAHYEEENCRLRGERDEARARAEHAEAIVNREFPALTQCPACYIVHDPRLGQPAPNDPLDDVLPLPAERAPESMAQQLKDDLDDLFIATSPLWETPEEAQAALDKAREQRRQSRQPKILPDHLPKSLDLDDTEGGSHG